MIAKLTLLFFLGFTCVVHAAGVTVFPSPGWQRAPDAQWRQLAAGGNYRIIDYSTKVGGGGANLLESALPGGVNHQVVEATVKGYETSILAQGQTVVSKLPANVGKLKGFCVTSRGPANGRSITIVTYLVFSDRAVYSIAIYGAGSLTSADPLVTGYLAQIRIDPLVVAGNLEADSPYEMGQKIGTLFMKAILFGGPVVILIVALVIYGRYRSARRPPPLPKSI